MSNRTKKIFWVAIAVLVPAVLYAANLTIPNTFSAGTPILSAQMNNNFTTVATAVDNLQVTCPAGQSVNAISITAGGTTCVPSSGSFINNGTAPQTASFNITDTGLIGTNFGIGVPSADYRFSVQGAPVAGTGTISASSGTTSVTGSGTAFLASQVGSVIATGSGCAGGAQVRTISAVTSNIAITVDVAWTTTFVGCAFTIAPPALLIPGTGSSTGNVGVGTSTPSQRIHIAGVGGGNQTVAKFGDAPAAIFLVHSNSNVASNMYFNNGWFYDSTGPASALDLTGGNFNFYSVPSGTAGTAATLFHSMGLGTTGNLFIAGVLTQGSSASYKKDIHFLDRKDLADALTVVQHTPVATYRYKGAAADSRVNYGVIAEHTPAPLLGDDNKSVNLSNTVGLLLASIQAQQEQINKQQEQIARLQAEVATMKRGGR
jgi:hypothetical protein